MSKTCTRCGETKPLDGFHRNKTKAGGRRAECKECVREYDRRYHEENRDKRRERNRRYYEENRDELRERACRYREENRDKEVDRKRRYHKENRYIINQGKKIRGAQRTRTSNLLASKKGVPYSPDEDAFLMADNGMSLYQKAVNLGRTYASCKARLEHLRAREAVDV